MKKASSVTGVESGLITIPDAPPRFRFGGQGDKVGFLKKHAALIRNSPSTILLPLLVLVTLAACGSALVVTALRREEDVLEDEAYLLAMETSSWFSDQLNQATLPLFSLAQFVNQLNDTFGSLPDDIGVAGERDSLPLVLPGQTHRNITGVCDNPELKERFTAIAAGIKRDSNMEGVLVNLQLAPQAVVCLLHPVNNTEDFEPPVFMDNTGAIGHDLLSDPKRNFIAEQTLESEKMVIAGPLSLRQCSDCDPTVERAFIARLPIDPPGMPGARDDQGRRLRWGFAVALINWNALIYRSNVFELFDERGWNFQLTRTDVVVDKETGDVQRKVSLVFLDETDVSHHKQVVVLADSPGYGAESGNSGLTVALETTNNEWEMTVSYNHDDTWKIYSLVAVALFSTLVAVLVYLLLAQKQFHAMVVAEQSQLLVTNAKQAAKDERDLNDFIAHEVRNPLSAAMSACTFVSVTVNEAQPLQTEESRAGVREDVRIIERSLKFINDLLRSMLDIHRAACDQLVLDESEADVLLDILEPVSAMLYHRDENFSVQVDCPENLIIRTDRLRLQQVVLNLGRNAAKFVEIGYVRLRAFVGSDGLVLIAVEDSGPGIPADKRENLFNRFQKSLDMQSQGTGIGLNLCKVIMDSMGGVISLDTSYDSGIPGYPGTRIVLSLNQKPLIQGDGQSRLTGAKLAIEHAPTKDASIEVEPGLGTAVNGEENSLAIISEATGLPNILNVLLVDDERILRKLACRSILKLCPGWTIREAASGETALQLCQENTFDLVLMDQYMASVERQLTGTETVRELRTQGCSSIICGLSANDLAASFDKAGADFFLLKPFPCKPEELQEALKRILSPRSAGR